MQRTRKAIVLDGKYLSNIVLSDMIREKKKEGKYKEAIQLQQVLIRTNLNFLDLAQNFYSLGKMLYLLGEYKYAASIFKICIRLLIINNPAMLDDYKAMKRGDQTMRTRLARFLRDPACHIGHAVFDSENADCYGREIQNYKKSLITDERQPHTKKEDEYNNKIAARILPLAFNELDDALADMSEFKDRTASEMTNLANMKF